MRICQNKIRINQKLKGKFQKKIVFHFRMKKVSVKLPKQVKRVIINTKNAPKAIGPYNQV